MSFLTSHALVRRAEQLLGGALLQADDGHDHALVARAHAGLVLVALVPRDRLGLGGERKEHERLRRLSARMGAVPPRSVRLLDAPAVPLQRLAERHQVVPFDELGVGHGRDDRHDAMAGAGPVAHGVWGSKCVGKVCACVPVRACVYPLMHTQKKKLVRMGCSECRGRDIEWCIKVQA